MTKLAIDPTEVRFFSGSSHPQLAADIADHLGVPIERTEVSRFSNDNLHIQLGASVRSRNSLPLTLALGALLGVVVTLTSVGAGAFGVVALLMLYPHLPTNHLAGTDIVHAVPLTLVAGTGHAITGSVDYQLLGNLLIGSLPGIVAGSFLSHRVPESVIRNVMGVVLFVLGLKLLT